jgi:hypothetical protein
MIHYSFHQFFTVIAILTFVYLAYVLLRYFRKEMNAMFSRKGMIHLQEQEPEEEIFGPLENITAADRNEQPHGEDFKKAEVIIPKIKEAIIYAGINNYDHLELYQAIKSIFTSYPLVNDPVMREGITELIIHECEKHGAVKPEKRELDELWEMASL